MRLRLPKYAPLPLVTRSRIHELHAGPANAPKSTKSVYATTSSVGKSDERVPHMKYAAPSASMGSHMAACSSTIVTTIALREKRSIARDVHTCAMLPSSAGMDVRKAMCVLLAPIASAKGVMLRSPKPSMTL